MAKTYEEFKQEVEEIESKVLVKPRSLSKSEKAGHRFPHTRVNKKWKKKWKEFCKYDMDWDYFYFLEMVVRKLEFMREYFIKDSYLTGESKNTIVDSLTKTLEVGHKLVTQDYDEYDEKSFQEEKKDVQEFFNLIGEYCLTWWD